MHVVMENGAEDDLTWQFQVDLESFNGADDGAGDQLARTAHDLLILMH